MKDKTLTELFKDSANKLNKNAQHSTALHSMGGYGEIDHDRICPFRSIPFDECPLCKIEILGKL